MSIELASQPGSSFVLRIECAASPVTLTGSRPGVSQLDATTLLSAVRIRNEGPVPAENVRITSISSANRTLTSPTLPVLLGSIAADGSAILDADFKVSQSTPGAASSLEIRGTYSIEGSPVCFALDLPFVTPAFGPGSALSSSGTALPHAVTGAPFVGEPLTGPDDDINQTGPPTPKGPVRGTVSPTTPETQLNPPPTAKLGRTAQADSDVVFVHDTTFSGPDGVPDDPSGASGGSQVVLATGNTYGALSTDDGVHFTTLDPTKIFPNRGEDGTLIDGGLCCDQAVHYSPTVNRFFWLMLFRQGSEGSRLRLAAASPEDLAATGGTAWTYWDLTSRPTPECTGLGLGNIQLDYPDLSVGSNFLYVSVDGGQGLQVIRLPLQELRDGTTVHFGYTDQANSTSAYGKHLIQQPEDEIFWAGSPSTSRLQVFSWKESSDSYFWRDVDIDTYPYADFVSKSPDDSDWLMSLFSGGPGGIRTSGVTSNGTVRDEVWFEFMGSRGGSFTQPQVQIVRLDRSDFHVIEQSQIWNPDIAFGYASLTTNAAGLVGVSLAFGGGPYYGSGAFGILGDHVVYYPCLSTTNAGRYGDYTTVRRASPNGLLFSGTGYCTEANGFEPHYVLFGRSGDVNPPPIP
jgi:hypothetical protein